MRTVGTGYLLLGLLFGYSAVAVAQCTNSSAFGTVSAPTSIGQTVIISTCSFAGEYATINDAVAGSAYSFSSSLATDFLTVREGVPSGNAIAWSVQPVSAQASQNGSLYLHINADASCAANFSCRTTSVTLVEPPEPPRLRPLNDSGQTDCFNANNLAVGCTEASTGDASTQPGQDGRFGRDARAAEDDLPKVGGGEAGFDFSRVCRSGQLAGTGDCPPVPAMGPGANDWGCTRDNVTHLLWAADTPPSGWNPSDPMRLAADLLAQADAAMLCGRSGWRVPRRSELRAIANYGRSQEPRIDTDYFPVGPNLMHWSGDSFAGSPGNTAWSLDFRFLDDAVQPKFPSGPLLLPVRLVIDDLERTCRAHLLAQPAAASGVYWIDPDGIGGHAPFRVRCDMNGQEVGLPASPENGGWTLLAKDPGTGFDMPFPLSQGGWHGDLAAGAGMLGLPGSVLLDLLPTGELRLQLDGGGWASKGIEQLPHLSRIDSAPRALDCTPDLHLLWNYDVEGRTIPLFQSQVGPACGCASLLNTPLPGFSEGTAGPGDANAHDGSGCWGVATIGPVAGQVWGR